jgi:hypothetical protein
MAQACRLAVLTSLFSLVRGLTDLDPPKCLTPGF